MASKEIALFWFRRDFRLQDNAGLYHALKSGENIQPIFIFDQNILSKLEDKDDRRVTFIYRQIERLKKELNQLGSDLWVFYGIPLEIHKKLLSNHYISGLYANRDYEPYARERDKAIFELYQSKDLRFRAFKDHVIFEKDEVLKNDGTPYTVYSPYARKWREKANDYFFKSYPTEEYFDHFASSENQDLLTLESMGFEPHEEDWSNSEIDAKTLKAYADKRDIPSTRGTTRISVHLRFGTVSIRALTRMGETHSKKWLNELIWRDFYQMILWHFPHVVERSFRSKYDQIPWRNNEEEFQAWCDGKTGYPIVDAGMRELKETGFMHNRVRMIVASFLTKHLLVDWRWGEAYFARKLIDFELASNNGGWQWASGSGVDAAPYFRVFNPYLQTDKFDPGKHYIRKWVPEFEKDSYPEPIVDHKKARERAINTYKEALS
jgi:deoxyribodipyrimidine photo-lyase